MNEINKFTLGLIVNPISGMGGSVGLKGTDGRATLTKAISLGAEPNALNRTKELLAELRSVKPKLKFVTCPKFMGEYALKEFGFNREVLEDQIFERYENIYDTTAEHTKIMAYNLKQRSDIDLLLFVGGDGTARDIQSVIGKTKPCLGIPAGVKIYSSVFAVTPKVASNLILRFLWGELPLKEAEVLDIDEQRFREGKLVSELYGFLLVPYAPDYSQRSKMGSLDSDLDNQERIAKKIVEEFQEGTNYLIGPGTTTKAIADMLNQDKSVLGVDLFRNKKIIAMDLNESDILNLITDQSCKIIVSPIGRQGFIFGRGNLQLSPNVIREVGIENIIIISTKYKLQNIPNQILRIDTRDTALDEKMSGLYRVVVDYDELRICEVK
ncbi:MAG: ATP-NAD kinase [Candidatus Lokiarchaeota archaeon]|nr:ATP-NAD kinase [Candidatus Lokiarchaeota archaeon]